MRTRAVSAPEADIPQQEDEFDEETLLERSKEWAAEGILWDESGDEVAVAPSDTDEIDDDAAPKEAFDDYVEDDPDEPGLGGMLEKEEQTAKADPVQDSDPNPAGSDDDTESTPSQEVRKIWDLFDDDEDGETAQTGAEEDDFPNAPPERSQAEMAREAMQMIKDRANGDTSAPDHSAQVTSMAIARPTGGAGRAKTRLLGFAAGDAAEDDVFGRKRNRPVAQAKLFPAGWLVVIDGPGRGASFALYSGVSQIGRGEDQSVQLNFGDMAISRENHAAIAYDEEQNAFYLGHGGKANIVRLNGRPVLSTEEISNADLIRIGETTLRFVALCGPDFAWDLTEDNEVGIA
ncbi:FHA domain-containing protein [Pseudoruegeria sp. HB172150]|uniref:FHA domain-containing protein n=1 Tax=Pseudoruegeria sp. HB172150 TaxID=2721164 RepID=UPI0020A6A826|nr:FHA domain-containing protein [Pseudoruegeria sp. HB172150]